MIGSWLQLYYKISQHPFLILKAPIVSSTTLEPSEILKPQEGWRWPAATCCQEPGSRLLLPATPTSL